MGKLYFMFVIPQYNSTLKADLEATTRALCLLGNPALIRVHTTVNAVLTAGFTHQLIIFSTSVCNVS